MKLLDPIQKSSQDGDEKKRVKRSISSGPRLVALCVSTVLQLDSRDCSKSINLLPKNTVPNHLSLCKNNKTRTWWHE